MDNFIRKISRILSLLVAFAFSAIFYFNYKGFVYDDGKIYLRKATAQAAEVNDIATVLPRNIAINTSQKYALGSEKAPLTMFEYSSLGCPHCADFHLDVEPELIKEYVDKGLLRIVFVNFPLDKNSMKAAMLSKCMVYNNYFGFINATFASQRSWWFDTDEEKLFRHAAEYGLSYDEAQACIKNKRLAEEIVADRQEGIDRLDIQGTPAFYIVGKDGNEIIYGATSFRHMKKYIDSRLERLGVHNN